MKRKGFTLIELLIVVAIIAILAAIAVPNFLEAQTRARVSRVKADMRTYATAIEAYIVDNNIVPYPGSPFSRPAPGGSACCSYTHAWLYIQWDPGTAPPYGANHHIWTLSSLTSPVSYLTSFQEDPFTTKYSQNILPTQNRSFTHVMTSSCFYGFRWNRGIVSVRATNGFCNPGNPIALYTDVKYYMMSTGPDAWSNFCFTGGKPTGASSDPHQSVTVNFQPYDATNGTVSAGELFYVGAGAGFPGQD